MGLGRCGISLLLFILTVTHAGGLQCRACGHTATPSDCQTWTNCGTGEVCYTREFKEPDGRQAFNLGCESTTLCTLFLDAEKLGNAAAPGQDNLCYNCCLTADCNKDLCRESVPKPTTTPKPKVCPDFYQMIYNKCYFFGMWETSWQDARTFCQKTKGSDLASFNSQVENDQVNTVLARLDSPIPAYWLGGFYSPANGEWEWVDRTLMVVKLWQDKFPPKLDHAADYYVLQPRPVNNRPSKWQTDTRGKTHAFICELTV